MQGVSISTASSMDVHGVSLSAASTVVHWRTGPGCIHFHNQHNGLAGCTPFHSQQYGREGCLPFHRQQYGRAGCIHFHSQQYRLAGGIPFQKHQYRLTGFIPFHSKQYGRAGCLPFHRQQYRIKGTQSGTGMLRYLTEIQDAGMPMPVPSYAKRLIIKRLRFNVAPSKVSATYCPKPKNVQPWKG